LAFKYLMFKFGDFMNRHVTSLFLVVALLGLSSEAFAFGFKLQASVGAGFAQVDLDGPLEFESGYGLSVGGAALLELGPVYAGLYAQRVASGPYFMDVAIEPMEVTVKSTSIGLMVKGELVLFFLQLHGGYTFGEAEFSVVGTNSRTDELSGLNFGAAGGLSIPIIPVILGLDVGPYFQFRQMSNSDDDSMTDLQYGLMVQVALGI